MKRLRQTSSSLSGKPLGRHKGLRRKVDKLKRKLSKPKVKIPVDPVEFFTDVLRIKPYPYQAAFLRDPNPLRVLRWCRRAGKTTVMSGADIHFAAHHPGSTTIITMPKYQQIKEIYFQSEAGLHAHLARMPREPKDYYNALIDEELQTIIRFKNGAQILPETPEPFTIRGHGPSRINIDEFNFIRQDRDLWLSALLPMTLTRVVHINIASTPWNKDSIYWQMCFDKHFKMFSGNIHEHSPPRYLKIWRDVLKPKGPLDPKQVDIMRDQYAGDPWRWKREMECAFVSDETSFLPSSLIIKCQNKDLEFAKFEDAPAGNFFVGWDLGRERDYGVAAVIDKHVDVYRLVHCHQFPLKTPYVTQMGYIKSLCQRWKTTRSVYYDHTGTKGVDEQITATHFPGLVGLDFTKPIKHGMAVLLKDLMMTSREADRDLPLKDARRKFELPYDRDVEAELNVEQWEQTKGSELYTFSHPQGSHDDRFWAICLAVRAASKSRGQLTVSKGEKPW